MSKRITCERCSGKGYIYVTFSEGDFVTATSCVCPECGGTGVQFVPSTNADRIRDMSDEELAKILTDYSNNGGWTTETGRQICHDRIFEWLKQPAEEEQL